MTFRAITIVDYPQLIKFWEKNYLLTKLDEFDRVKLFLEKNPGLSLVGEDKGQVVATALGSFDGRRGSIQKVVVSVDCRKKGIGEQLVREIVKKLQSAGALDIRFNVAEELVPFYKKCGFKKDIRPTMIIKSF